eukprot:12546225-Alexandrium_andersonii.AAC.1
MVIGLQELDQLNRRAQSEHELVCLLRPHHVKGLGQVELGACDLETLGPATVSYTHLRAHETSAHL